MRYLLALLTIPLLAQTPTMGYGDATIGRSYYGATSVFPGNNAYWELPIHSYVDVACDNTTDTCDSSPYAITGNEQAVLLDTNKGGVFLTAATLPAGLRSLYGGEKATYTPCITSGTTFELRRGWYGTVDTNGTAVTATAGYTQPPFDTNLVAGRPIKIAGVSYTINTITDATHLTLGSSAGTQSAAAMLSGCGGVQETFTTNGSGVKIIFNAGVTTYMTAISGFPMGTTFSYKNTDSGGITGDWPFMLTYPYAYQGKGTLTLVAAIPMGATPGSYTGSITMAANSDGSGATSTFTWPITVINFTPISHTPPSSAPAIPDLATWETSMIASGSGSGPNTNGGGAWWCDKATGVPLHLIGGGTTFSFGTDAEAYYYDGPRAMSQIATYTSDTDWNNCLHNWAEQYRAYYVVAGAPGYRIFPHGLGIEYVASGNAAFKTALDQMVTVSAGSLYCYYGGRVDDKYTREDSYCGDVLYVLQHYAGESANAHWQLNAELVMGQMLAYCSGGYNFARIWFQAGLAAESLIQYYSITGDTRVPWIMNCLKTAIYADYSTANHVLPYASDGNGPYCNNSASWYALDVIGNCGDDTYTSGRNLNQLISPLFAWYWQYTGDSTTQAQGDELWSYGVNVGLPFGGKNYTQNYRWSFDYVTWRSQTTPSAGGSSSIGNTTFLGSVTTH